MNELVQRVSVFIFSDIFNIPHFEIHMLLSTILNDFVCVYLVKQSVN